MPLTAALIALAGLGYFGRSLVMMVSVAGIAVTLWLTRRRSLRRQLGSMLLGGVGAALLAELVHLLFHHLSGDQPDHGGFWLSAVLVGLINSLAIAAVAWLTDARARRARVATSPRQVA